MWLGNRTPVFGVELHADKPGVVIDLHDLHQVVLGVYAGGHHAGFLILLQVGIVEFITMAVTFGYVICPVNIKNPGAFDKLTGIGA